MKRIMALMLSLVIVLFGASCGQKTADFKPQNHNKISGTAYTDKKGTDWVECGRSGSLILSFMPHTTHFRVENINDGSVWHSNPLSPEEDPKASKLTQMRMMSTVVLEYANVDTKKRTSLNLYTASVKSGKYEIFLLDNGVSFRYTVSEVGGTAKLDVYIENDELVTAVSFEKNADEKPEIIISSISAAEYLVSGTVSDDGYLFLPDGSGALVDFKKPFSGSGEYSRPVFGEEPTDITADYYLQCDNQSLYLPVFGAVRGQSAIFAVAENGAECGTLKANACGVKTSFANAYLTYGFADSVEYNVGNYTTELFDKSGNPADAMTTRYFFLTEEEANYSGMARLYRNYLIEKYKLADKNTSLGFYADVYGAVVKQVSTLGVPHDKTVVLTDPEDLKEITDFLKKSGAENVTVRYRLWNNDELKGNKVNGISAFSGSVLKEISDISDVRVYPAIMRMQSSIGAGFLNRMFNASGSITGLPFSWHDYSYSTLNEKGDTIYRLKLPKLTENAQKILKGFENKRIDNIAFGDIGKDLYCDFSGDGYNRSETKKAMEKLVLKIKSQSSSLMLDSPNAYAAVYSDVIYNAPIDHSNHDLLTHSVPFYTMVMGGILECVAPSFNSNNIGDDIVLYSAAAGASVCYTWIKSDVSELIGTKLSNLSDINFDSTKDRAAEQYASLKELYKLTENSRIHSHDYINDNVSVTVYENGVRVYVNFGDVAYTTTDGTEIAAKSFTAEEVKE